MLLYVVKSAKKGEITQKLYCAGKMKNYEEKFDQSGCSKKWLVLQKFKYLKLLGLNCF
jgi:hypothetical protein